MTIISISLPQTQTHIFQYTELLVWKGIKYFLKIMMVCSYFLKLLFFYISPLVFDSQDIWISELVALCTGNVSWYYAPLS